MLEALPQHSYVTATPWFKTPRSFSCPLRRDVMAAAGANGKTLSQVVLLSTTGCHEGDNLMSSAVTFTPQGEASPPAGGPTRRRRGGGRGDRAGARPGVHGPAHAGAARPAGHPDLARPAGSRRPGADRRVDRRRLHRHPTPRTGTRHAQIPLETGATGRYRVMAGCPLRPPRTRGEARTSAPAILRSRRAYDVQPIDTCLDPAVIAIVIAIVGHSARPGQR